MTSFRYGGLFCPANHTLCLEVSEDFTTGQFNILGQVPLDTDISPWWEGTFYTESTQTLTDTMELVQRLIQETNYHLNQAQVEVDLAKQTTGILTSASTRSAQYAYTWWDWVYRGYGGLFCPANHTLCLEVSEDFTTGQLNILGQVPLDTDISPWWEDTFYTESTQTLTDTMELVQRLIQETNYHLNQAQGEVDLAKQTTGILTSASTRSAQYATHGGTGYTEVLFGAVAASTDWNMTSYGSPSPYDRGEMGTILPIALQHLTPNYVSIMGIGAIAAAVMSSMDSLLLSSASLFTNNMYKPVIRKQASEREMQWVIKISVLVVGLVGMGLAFMGNNALTFWVLGTDVMYTLILPQFICILFYPVSNGYGAVGGYILGAMLRLLSGEPMFYLAPIIHFPGGKLVDGVYIQNFPYRTLAMLLSLCAIILISYVTSLLFEKGFLPKRWDVMQVKTPSKPCGSANKKGNADYNQPVALDQLLDTNC
ncbi:hypothetical protein AAFF_G00363210 [Aldrovandia affinis]|uniref:Uncharacterized protein n=1 Tax=Aldrovandia affinis TaxID=143900 RepID=A0AAD7R4U9_9TELE|nr:hypothetical protein AAFF_G00363210 [Aldrovandia affinis]